MNKKLATILFLIITFFSLNSFSQKENRFKVIIEFEIKVNNESDSKALCKVSDNKIYYEKDMFNKYILTGDILYKMFDFTPFKMDNKIYIKEKIDFNKELIEQIVKTNYTNQTKTIHGIDGKLLILTYEEGDKKEQLNVWYSEDIGPLYNFVVFPLIKGFPLEVTGEDLSIKIKSIKVEEIENSDFEIPREYIEVTENEYISIMQEAMINAAMKVEPDK